VATILKPHERLVCVGQTAARAPDGSFLPAVPLYRIDDVGEAGAGECDRKAVLTVGESGLYDDIAAVFGGKFKQYIDGVEAAGGTV